VAGGLVFRVFQQDGNEHVGMKEIDVHRSRNFSGSRGTQFSYFRLLLEAVDAAVLVDVDYAETKVSSRSI